MSKGVLGSIVGVAAALMLLAGCGGSGSSSLTKAEFAKQANKVCKQQEEERVNALIETSQKLGIASEASPDKAKQEKAVLAAMPALEKEAQMIDELGAPEGDEKKVEEIVAAIEEMVANIRKNPMTALTSQAPYKKADELVVAYGLHNCKL